MHDLLLITHFIGLALGVGTGFANLNLGLSTRDMEMPARVQFMLRTLSLAKNGSYGLLLLIVSGLGLMFERGVPATFAWGGGMFHAKLTLVLVLIGLLGYMQVTIKRVKQAGGGPLMAKLPTIGRFMLLTSVSIVVFAVLAFH
jgi:uncharacterized membrane protein